MKVKSRWCAALRNKCRPQLSEAISPFVVIHVPWLLQPQRRECWQRAESSHFGGCEFHLTYSAIALNREVAQLRGSRQDCRHPALEVALVQD